MSIQSIVASGQRLIATTLLDRSRIQDRALVRDSTGGHVESFVERTRTEACRFVQLKELDPGLELDSVFGRAEAVCEFPVSTVIAVGDRIHNLVDGSLWQIVKIFTPPSTLAVVGRAGIKAL